MAINLTYSPPANRLKLTAYILKYPKQFTSQAIGGIIYNIVTPAGAVYLGKTIDAITSVYAGKAGISLFYRNLILFIFITLIFQIARYFKRYYMRYIVNTMSGDIRAGLIENIFGMSLSSLSHENIGDLMSRNIGDVDQVGASVQTTITEIWDTVLLMLSYFVYCMFYSPTITLLAVIPIPLTLLLAQAIRKPVYNLSLNSRKAASKINVHLRHNVSGIALLRLFGLEKTERGRFSKLLDDQYKWLVSSALLQNGMTPLYILCATLGTILVVGMGGNLVIGGVWTIGTFTAFLNMFLAMSGRTNTAANVMNTWHGAKASWVRICEKITRQADEETTAIKSETTEQTGLSVDKLGFQYPIAQSESIHDISFEAKRGQIIGITGSVGSGKSALAAALSGLYPISGSVTLDGVPVRDLPERSRYIAYMDSEHFVFSDDVTRNITLERNGQPLENVIETACLKEDIDSFEQGMDTKLMERGVRVSGGQRQRISLARALYGNETKLIILDDPFSAIDALMEQTIMDNLRATCSDKIILLFSHRLATFPDTDEVIVLRDGVVCQIGTHEQLVNQNGVYKDIFTAQKVLREGEDE